FGEGGLQKMRKWRICLITIVVIAFNLPLSYAHENTIVHSFVLTARAWKYLKDSPTFTNKYTELDSYFNLPPANLDILPVPLYGTLGTIEEDNLLDIFHDEVPPFSWLNHFYNPATGLEICLTSSI
ncbi:MAG: hypothetical protein Q7W05_10375, partial [Deltaproteobacteria bacterium]|nr:hypothetical protein [Deltaproteobacteria bacterium]